MNNREPFNHLDAASFETESAGYREERSDSDYEPPNTIATSKSKKMVKTPAMREEELKRVNTKVKQNYLCYLFTLLVAIMLYFAMVVVFWDPFVHATTYYPEEIGYFVLLIVMILLWLFGTFCYIRRSSQLQTIFIIALFICLVIAIIVVVIDFAIERPDSNLDQATDPRVMLGILIIFPCCIIYKGLYLRRDLHKRQILMEYLGHLQKKEESSNEKGKGPEEPQETSEIQQEILVL